MGEEEAKGTVTPAPESAGTGAPETTPQAAGTGGDIQSLVKAEVERIRREYEGPGGHIAKLKSKADKAQAELDRLAAQERQRAVETYRQANAVAQQDPDAAYRMLAPQHEALLRQQQQATGQQEWYGWVDATARDLELLTGDDEADGKTWEQIDALGRKVWAENDTTAAPAIFQHELGRIAKDRQKEARTKAEKAREQALASIPDQVRREVTRALAEAGYTEPDTSTPGSPAPPENELMKLDPTVRIRRILAQERRGQGK